MINNKIRPVPSEINEIRGTSNTNCVHGIHTDIESQGKHQDKTARCSYLDTFRNIGFNILRKITPKNIEVNNRSIKGDQVFYFPWIYDDVTYAEYRINSKVYFDVYLCIFPTLLLIATFIGMCLVQEMPNPYYGVSWAIYCVFLVAFIFYVFINGAKFFVDIKGDIMRGVIKYQKTWVGRNIEDLLGICTTLYLGFILLSRISIGQCRPSTTMWESLNCNNVASNNSVSIYIYMYV
jgi:hypothetical protein